MPREVENEAVETVEAVDEAPEVNAAEHAADDTPKSGFDDGGYDVSVDARARALGWRPESEWDHARAEREGRRAPKKFMTAREYIAQTEDSMPMMRAQLRKLTDMVEQQQRKNDDMHQILVEQKRLSKEGVVRAYERGKYDAEAAMRKAVEDGDVDAFDRARERRDAIDRQQRDEYQAEARRNQEPEQRQQEAPPVHPDTEQWLAQNSWFFTNPVLQNYMKSCHGEIVAGNPAMDQWDSLESAKDMVVRKYPAAFGKAPAPQQQSRRGSNAVSQPSGDRPAKVSGAAKLAHLPKSDQDVFYRQQQRFKEQGIEFTADEFLRDYNSTGRNLT